jgi:hypothetical protein
MRKYQPAWNAIKQNGQVSLSASPELHRRIILGIRTEKKKDLGWKLMQLEQGKKYKLIETIDGSLITFKLVSIATVPMAKLTIHDL